ncbi:hypothetical protein RvVAT039_pl02660 (plasmid) [Agrobacterium vitis]|nr:hypothetical protein RvVAT039_pl02660 [Agrobacterium vitis]
MGVGQNMEVNIRPGFRDVRKHFKQSMLMQKRLATGNSDRSAYRGKQSRERKMVKHVMVILLGRLRAHDAQLVTLLSNEKRVVF